jgi:DNA-binding transcriptional ArsR family regulator
MRKHEDLLRAVRDTPDDPGLSISDMVKETGLPRDVLERRLRALKDAGRVIIGTRMGSDRLGRRVVIPVYVLKDSNATLPS